MKKLTYIYIIFAFFAFKNVKAQQDPQRTFYYDQMNFVNPAYAGAEDHVDITLGVRSQWAGVQGAPESQSFMASSPVGKNLGIGIAIQNDKTFIEKQIAIGLDFSYKIALNTTHDLYFGLKASGASYSINSAGLITYGIGQDASLSNYNSMFSPNFGIGVYLKNSNYFVSLSAPKILANERLAEENGSATLSSERQHFYAAAGYNISLGNQVKLQLSTMYRYVNSAPSSLDITSIFNLGNRFNIGAAYRVNAAFSGIFIFKVNENFKLGYAYETPTNSSLNGLENASHELLMKLQL